MKKSLLVIILLLSFSTKKSNAMVREVPQFDKIHKSLVSMFGVGGARSFLCDKQCNTRTFEECKECEEYCVAPEHIERQCSIQ